MPTHTKEYRSIFWISLIYAFRMFGLFMILPIFGLYAQNYQYATPALIGCALGMYGLTQALLQIPFGLISDRIGRKKIITLGLLLFAFGSVIAAVSSSIYGVIIGRALQGCGAIGSTLTALLADLTHEKNRTKAMAMIGITIGISFSVSMVIGSVINHWIGLSGIFWLTAILASSGIIILFIFIPNPKREIIQKDVETVPKMLTTVLKNPQLLRCNFSIWALHFLLMANFLLIPIFLKQQFALQQAHEWLLYLPVLLLSFIFMLPLIIIAEKKQQLKQFMFFSIGIMLLTQLLWLFIFKQHSILLVAINLTLFLTAFNFLEASLPSLVSKTARIGQKGTALGIFSTSQFLGIFLGSTISGLLYQHSSANLVFTTTIMVCLAWLLITVRMTTSR